MLIAFKVPPGVTHHENIFYKNWGEIEPSLEKLIFHQEKI